MKRILITGCGGFAATGFIRCLRLAPEKFYLVGVDVSPRNLFVSLCDVNYLVPEPTDKNYLNILNKIIIKEKIDLIWSQPQIEIQMLSKIRDQLKARLFLADDSTVQLCYDKQKTIDLLYSKKIPVPNTILLYNKKDLEQAFNELGNPVWLRAIMGAGGKGSFLAKNLKEALFWVDYNNGWNNTFAASEYLPGKGYGCDMMFYHGKLVFSQIKERLSYFMGKVSISGVSGTTGVLKSIHDKDIDKLCERTVRAVDVKPHGPFAVDLKCDKNGKPHITEINVGRFLSSSVSLFYKTKFLAPYIAVKLAFDEKIPFTVKKNNPVPKDIIIVRQLDVEPAIFTEKQLNTIIKRQKEYGVAKL